MNKNLFNRLPLSLIALLWSFSTLFADPVSPEQATQVAKHFFQSTKTGSALGENLSLNLLNAQAGDHNPFYIFNVNDHAGFVIIAADDAVNPVLGYSDTGAFDSDHTPESMEKWLEGYKHEIFYVVQNKIKATESIEQKWKTLYAGVPATPDGGGVGPLLETTWNQNPYENLLCPGGSVTGCVATAMAQIMYYHKYPAQGQGTHSYVENNYGTLSANFGSAIYQWGVMPWHPSSPNPDISLLMLHCGISVDMDYSPQGSGTLTKYVADALKKYFKYDPNTTTYVERSAYPGTAWTTLLKAELDAFRPMQYRGTGTAGAHSFVCDGYDDNGFFHFNWGWGGSSDGFFVVDALNPGTIGTGGGAGGFNTDQGAVIGIQPDPAQKPELKMASNLIVSNILFSDGQPFTIVSTDITNVGAQPFSGFVTLALYDLEGNLMGTSTSNIIEYFGIVGGGALIDNESFSFQSLPPGNYHAALVYRENGNNAWTKIPDGQFLNDVLVWSLTGSSLTVEVKPVAAPDFVFQNGAFDITASVINESASSPIFSGPISADLHNLDGTWIQQIAVTPSIFLMNGQPGAAITLHATGLNVPAGTYRIVLWAKNNALAENFQKVNVQYNFDANAFITILAPAPPPDVYEPNDNLQLAKLMPLNFAGNTAFITTFGSDHHTIFDEDFYKVVFPADPSFKYVISGRLQDAGSSNNGGNYTNDCFWRYHDGNAWSEPFDDELLVPGMNFLMPSSSQAYFFVKPSMAGTSGNYLLDLVVTRIQVPANDDPCGAITVPVNGIPQTGYSNQNATASSVEFGLLPAPGDCAATWCSTETGARLAHAMWFKFVAPSTGAVEVSTCNLADFDTQIALYSASDCGNTGTYTLLAANDDGGACNGYTSLLTKGGLVPGQTYYVLLDGYENGTGTFGIKITAIQASSTQNVAATPDVLLVSPNPTDGLLNIQFQGDRFMDAYTLSDLSGRSLQTAHFDRAVQELSLNLDPLPKGVYLLQVRAGNQIFTQKVVLQ